MGSACPADDIPADVPPDALFVFAGAGGGDGTRARPFGAIAEANRVASAGATIAVRRGRYDEVVRITRDDVTLVGACPGETIMTATSSSIGNDAVVFIGGRNVTVPRPSVPRAGL